MPTHPAAVINADIGSFSLGDRHVTFTTGNQIPTPLEYDKYSLPLAIARPVSVSGFRMLFCFRLRAFGPDNRLLLGGFVNTNDPITDLANQNFVGMLIEAEKGSAQFRGFAGGGFQSPLLTLGSIDRFVNRPLLVEIKTVGVTAAVTHMEFRLFDQNESLDVPIVSIPVFTLVPPTITHAAMTSLGRHTPELPNQPGMTVELRYVDVESGDTRKMAAKRIGEFILP